ncbi:MAG: hypothetical protein A2W09_02785 [Deltaproteobacteria bacterium RBG_16_50_11]|nr:MAG: hypothetical protein A2W09_02785 [Deltaproteobacteria bacterium RBG_16_50_11]
MIDQTEISSKLWAFIDDIINHLYKLSSLLPSFDIFKTSYFHVFGLLEFIELLGFVGLIELFGLVELIY